MREEVVIVMSLLMLSTGPYSCHKPTPKEDYAGERHCFGVLDANLRAVSAAQMKAAGIDRYAVEHASQEIASGAFDVGRRLGLAPRAIYADLENARAAYHGSHSWVARGSARRTFAAFGRDFDGCLTDFYGRPND